MGTAGYGDEIWSVGQSYGQAPIYTPALYNPNAPAGSRWTFNLAPSTQERMYHSTVVLLTDGSLMISGSNVSSSIAMLISSHLTEDPLPPPPPPRHSPTRTTQPRNGQPSTRSNDGTHRGTTKNDPSSPTSHQALPTAVLTSTSP